MVHISKKKWFAMIRLFPLLVILPLLVAACTQPQRHSSDFAIRGGTAVPTTPEAPTTVVIPERQAAPPQQQTVLPPLRRDEIGDPNWGAPQAAPLSQQYGALQTSRLACSVQGGRFNFQSRDWRDYQPFSFVVGPGEVSRVRITQDNGDRSELISVAGDLSGVGVLLQRGIIQPGVTQLGFRAENATGAFTEPQLIRGRGSSLLSSGGLFDGATLSCGFRSPPGILPPTSPSYYRY